MSKTLPSNLKVYSSETEILQEIFDTINPNVPKSILYLWEAIRNYGLAQYDMGGEGNSGEFHDDREEQRLMKNLEIEEKNLIEKFSEVTGYLPVKLKFEYDERKYMYKGANKRTQYMVVTEELWELQKIS